MLTNNLLVLALNVDSVECRFMIMPRPCTDTLTNFSGMLQYQSL